MLCNPWLIYVPYLYDSDDGLEDAGEVRPQVLLIEDLLEILSPQNGVKTIVQGLQNLLPILILGGLILAS